MFLLVVEVFESFKKIIEYVVVIIIDEIIFFEVEIDVFEVVLVVIFN